MLRRYIFVLFAATALAAVPSPLKAQQYSQLLDQWKATNEKIDEAYEAMRRAEAEERESTKQAYVDLVNMASNELLPKLEAAAIDEYRQQPNQDRELARMLVGMAANHARHDQHEKVLRIGELLIDHNCPVRAIYGLAGMSAYALNKFDLAETYLNKAKLAGSLDFQGTQLLDDIPTAQEAWQEEQEIRAAEAVADDLPRVKLTTDKGDLVFELFENEAPQTVANFIHLIEEDFYDGLTFHRVMGGFMAQAGCPVGDGSGDAGYKIPCECYQENHRRHFRGSLSMAKSSDPSTSQPLPDSGGSQFFVTFRRTHDLDGKYTVFGRLIEGEDVLAKIRRREQNPFNTQPLAPPDKIVAAEVLRKRDHPYEPTKIVSDADSEPSGDDPAADPTADQDGQAADNPPAGDAEDSSPDS